MREKRVERFPRIFQKKNQYLEKKRTRTRQKAKEKRSGCIYNQGFSYVKYLKKREIVIASP